MFNTEPATTAMQGLNPKPYIVHGTGGTPASATRPTWVEPVPLHVQDWALAPPARPNIAATGRICRITWHLQSVFSPARC